MNETENNRSNETGIIDLFNEFLWAVRNLNGTGTVEFSDTVKEVTGYTVQELKELPSEWMSLVHEEDANEIKSELADFESDKDRTDLKLVYRILTKNKETIWLKENLKVERNDKGKIIRSFRVAYDITELKTRESRLAEKSKELEELNNAKDKFISIVSHDLRAPFTSLLGFSEILMNEPTLSDDEKNEYLSYIYDASKTQLQLINYLLDWSRLQTGRMQLDPKRVNLKSIVHASVSSLTGTAMRKNIEIHTDIDGDYYVSADERLLNQVITNLVSNAVKFTPAEKDVHVSVSRFKEGLIELIVRDEGIGIKEEDQSKLFRIDQKFTTEGTNGEKGTGFGLTLVKEIVEKHGGDIWFYSKPEEGTEFHVTLPEAKNLIVVVEDDPSMNTLFKMAAERALSNFEVIQVENGYEAMSIVFNKVPTLVITDHEMPLMNGIQLVEAMRKKTSNKNVPVVVISARLNDDLIKRYRDLGVVDLIHKPFVLDELVNVIVESVA